MAKNQDRKLDWREERRFRAWHPHQQGWKQCDIATALGATEGTVSQWLARARNGGTDDLHNRTRPGTTARLTDQQRERIPALLALGAEHYGFLGGVWTSKRVAEVIEREFGVRYNVSHLRRLLHVSGLLRTETRGQGHPAQRGIDRCVGAAETAGDQKKR